MMQSNAAHNVPNNFKNAAPTVHGIVRHYSIGELEKILERRADRGTIGKWRRGERPVPQWARDMLASYHRAEGERLLELARAFDKEKAPGRKAGARNLAIWRAANPR